MAGQSDRVVTFGPPKEAALYFEQVLPLDFSMGWFGALGIKDHSPGLLSDTRELGIPFENAEFDEGVIESLLPGIDDPHRLYANQLAVTSALPITILLSVLSDKESRERMRMQDQNGAFRAMFKLAGLDIDEVIDGLNEHGLDIDQLVAGVVPRLKWFLKKSGFIGAPSWLTLSLSDDIDSGPFIRKDEAAYAVALKNLNLVDPRSLSWEQIIEFRKDKQALSSLRRFRMFFSDSYEGKNETYVRDKLSLLLEDYERTTKVWGFDTIEKTLSVAVSNQNIMASTVATLAPAAAGMPLPIAAGAGALITLGKCALEFSKVFVDKRREQLSNSVSYLSKLKKLGATS